MPVIARFYGLIIKMYLLGKEHGIAHIHVLYNEHSGVINVQNGTMIEGDLPPKALAMALEWTALYRLDLLEMWDTQQFRQLPPLE